jgi:anti-sigma-K factor RskA
MSVELENHVTDLLPAFVLDILTDEETNQVVVHLAECPTCQAEFSRMQLVADDLPLALVQTAPPPAVKDKLMRTIRSRQEKPIAAIQPTFFQKLTNLLRVRLPALGLALIAVMALGNLLLWSQLNLAKQQANTPMRVIALANTSDSPQAMGTLIMDQNGHYGTLVVDHLATLDFGHQYQIWLNRDGERISAGLFSVNHEGYASMELLAPLALIQYDTIGITVEPTGGSPGPTGAKVLGGNIIQY